MTIKLIPTNLERDNRGMLTHSELMKKATGEKGSPLTKSEEWFVWVLSLIHI